MALEVQIKKKLPGFQLDVAFAAGDETLALLGASGCGKSLTLKCIAGIERPDEGRIVLDGRVLFDARRRIDLPPQRRGVGYLFQSYALFPTMTVEQNIAAGAWAVQRSREGRREVVRRYVEACYLTGLEGKYPSQLSGGQQQRVALARILASQPQAILLDEPFSALDSYLKWQLEQQLVTTLGTFTGTCLWVSHDRDEAYRNCARVCVMEEGRCDPVVTMASLLHDPKTSGAARLAGCKNFAHTVAGERPGTVQVPEWGVTLACGGRAVEGLREIGLHAHQLHVASAGEENRIPCRVCHVTQDVGVTIVLLRPEGGGGGGAAVAHGNAARGVGAACR